MGGDVSWGLKLAAKARELPAVSAEAIRSDFDYVAKVWGSVALFAVEAAQLENLVDEALIDWSEEGFRSVQVDTGEDGGLNYAQVNAMGGREFRPIRAVPRTDGKFGVYGHSAFYRRVTLEKILILTGHEEQEPDFDIAGVANMVCVTHHMRLAPRTQVELVLGCPGEVNKERAPAIVAMLEGGSRVSAGASDRMVVSEVHGSRSVEYVVCLVLNTR